MHDYIRRLSEEGYLLPDPPRPVASYSPCVRVGNLVYVSGQLPMTGGELLVRGLCPQPVTVQQAQEGAVQCLLNGLAILGQELNGDWDRLKRVVRLGVFVQSADDFHDQPLVANGASDLCVEVFGDVGRHARAAVGVNALPLDATVEVEFLFEIHPEEPREVEAVTASEAVPATHESMDIVAAVQGTSVSPPAALR